MVPAGDHHLVTSRPFRAGAFNFLVASSSAELTRLADRLFVDLPAPLATEDDITPLIVTRSGDDGFDIVAPNIGQMSSLTLPAAVTMLVAAVNLSVLEAEPDRLHLHAAGAVRQNRATVLSAPRGTGKTTTVVHLAERGWELISDETITVAPGDDCVRGFPKPLSIKPGGRRLVPGLVSSLLPHVAVADDAALHVPLSKAGASIRAAAEPNMVVLLQRPPEVTRGTPPSSAPVHPADMVVRLMAETLDAGRFGQRAAAELARLAARCRCCEVTIGDPEETARLIEQLSDDATTENLPVTQHDAGAATSPDVVTVSIGDRVVLHEQPEGRILALDAAATQVWLTLGGWISGEAALDLSGPIVSQFVDRLAVLGLLRSTHGQTRSGRTT